MFDLTAITPDHFHQLVTIEPIFTEDAEAFEFGEARSLPLGEAIVLMLDGEPGFNTSEARILWNGHSLDAEQAKAIAGLPHFPQI